MNKLCFTIPGTIRIKKNSRRIFGAGRKKINLPSEAYEAWELKARQMFMLARFRFEVFAAPCHVKVLAFYESHEPDLSGILESVGDCFEKIIWKNDKQIVSWDGSRKERDKENPRTEITVEW